MEQVNNHKIPFIFIMALSELKGDMGEDNETLPQPSTSTSESIDPNNMSKYHNVNKTKLFFTYVKSVQTP